MPMPAKSQSVGLIFNWDRSPKINFKGPRWCNQTLWEGSRQSAKDRCSIHIVVEQILRINSQRAAGWTVKQASRRRDFSKFSCHTGSCLAYTWRPDLLLFMFCHHFHNCSMDSELNEKKGACKKFCSRSCGIEFMSIQAKKAEERGSN